MRTLTKFLVPGPVVRILGLAGGVLAGGVLLPATVRAQPVDVQPPMPNVLIMLDTSGSMSRKMGTDAFPDCDAGTPADLNESRWFAVVQALTGEVADADIGCQAIERTGDPFEDTYGGDIYDRGYYIPYFQLQSQGCAYVPRKDDWDKKWHDFGDKNDDNPDNDAIVVRRSPFGGGDKCDQGFVQASNGIIDGYRDLVRFGLMTFDPLVDPRVELQGEKDKTDSENGSKGTFSYWFSVEDDWKGTPASRAGSWRESGGPGYAGHAAGAPPLCEADQDMEVGARGPAAPPWEGRLMGFGDYRAPVDDVRKQNENIEKVILTARPFGATPLAGMFADAADFILNDDTVYDPKGNERDVPLGPKDDDLWDEGKGCRPFHVILITDGEPNLDLLPDCTQDGGEDGTDDDGRCPFPSIVDSPLYPGHSEDDSTVNILSDPSSYNISFHVVGVSLNEVTDGGLYPSCADYRTGGAGESRCDDADATAQEKTCCLLNAIAEVGQTERAYFASSTDDVRTSLNVVLDELSAGTASRTTPVFQSIAPTFYLPDGSPANAVGHEILSSLKTTVGSGMWAGRLERIRFTCAPPPVHRAAFNRALGDDYDGNLAIAPDQRFLITAIPTTNATETWRSLRPDIDGMAAADDDIGEVDADPVAALAATWAAAVPTEALALEESACDANFDTGSDLDDCRTQLLRWYTGQESTADIDRIPGADPDRSPSPLGAIYHSQPVIVGPPREFVRDESYDVFAIQQAARPTVVYAATIDGQLHAFLLGDNTARLAEHEPVQADLGTENNELWSFVPPIVLPYLNENVNKHALLLDGGITVKNIAFERTAGSLGGTVAEYVDQVQYHTAMVVSSGNASTVEGGGYYFALDVTDPHPDVPGDFDDDDDDDPRLDTPKFLWQLSRSKDANNIREGSLFGDAVPAAAITSIAYLDPDTNTVTEVAVAILAGGRSAAPEAVSYRNFDHEGLDLWKGDDTFAPRDEVRNWGDSRADRSVTIVRMDTGEVLWRFQGLASDPQVMEDERTKTVGFLAPMSGTPVPFPGLPGQVSSRVFIGDAEGMLWAIDFTNPDPEEWSMEVAWDAYHEVDQDEIEEGDVVVGPVENVPVVSVNEAGDPVVIFATGAQESFYQNTGKNFVVSLRDDPLEEGYQRNWELDLEETPDLGSEVLPSDTTFNTWGAAGQRVTGPINIFDGVVYFSTFVPSGEACEVGVSRVWGVHYLDATAGAPVAAWDPDADGVDDYFEQDDEAIIFGVAIGQQPSCRDSTAETINDPVFGRYTTFDSNPPGGFELVVQTGRKGDAAGANQPTTRTRQWSLKTPVSSVRVDGWASIVE